MHWPRSLACADSKRCEAAPHQRTGPRRQATLSSVASASQERFPKSRGTSNASFANLLGIKDPPEISTNISTSPPNMVKFVFLVALGVYLSCVAAAASMPGDSPSTRNLRSAATAEAESREAVAAGAWTKLGNAMEGKFRIENQDKSTTGMEARVKAMNAPHHAMPNVVMEARKKHRSGGTKKADHPRNTKFKPNMMEARNAHMKNLKAAAAQRAKLEAFAMEARNDKKTKQLGTMTTSKKPKHKGKKHSMEAQAGIYYNSFSKVSGKP